MACGGRNVHQRASRATFLIRQRGLVIISTTNQSTIAPKKLLVASASGLPGVAAIEKFLAAGWDVVGVSRRKPELPSDRKIDILSVDLRDEAKTRVAFGPLLISPTRLCTRSLTWSWVGRARIRSRPTTLCCATSCSRSCACSADAAAMHRSKPLTEYLRMRRYVIVRPSQDVTAPGRFAVAGWTDEQTRYWLDSANSCARCG
jgi:hypothetical protein